MKKDELHSLVVGVLVERLNVERVEEGGCCRNVSNDHRKKKRNDLKGKECLGCEEGKGWG